MATATFQTITQCRGMVLDEQPLMIVAQQKATTPAERVSQFRNAAAGRLSQAIG